MYISLNWLRDFVDIPTELDPRDLAERFTVTTAEVEGVEHINCPAKGLICAVLTGVERISDSPPLSVADLHDGRSTARVVTAAESLEPGDVVVYAPPGASIPGIGLIGERVIQAGAQSVTSRGLIVAGDALGLATVGQRALWAPPATRPGTPVDPALLSDWIIEVDNKSITNRPDLWGHYGIAREFAAMLGLPLRPCSVAPLKELTELDLPEVPIVIDDPVKCPRYSALRFTGVQPQPAPLWMQIRLAHVGLRPIDVLVDLTNYIMAELGQPMHAFDASGLERIEVATAAPGEKFTTLDGVQRTMPEGTLMIQSNRRSVAIAGIMGGADTEVSSQTTDLLLESANFEPATIRRAATAMGHRTDASARFEKSLDPQHTVLAIQRFVHLARTELPDMRFTSRLSDCFPQPPEPVVIRLDPAKVNLYLGRHIDLPEIRRILTALDFGVRELDGILEVTVPSFRATKDITIEADVIEEISRSIGYASIAPVLPTVTVRYAEPDAMGRLERQTLGLFCGGSSYAEIHRYIWFDDDWLRTLGYDPGPTITLRNPAAASMARLRTTLVPGLLSAVDLNRHHLDRFELVEVGGVFPPDAAKSAQPTTPNPRSLIGEYRHLGLAVVVPGRKPAVEDEVLRRMKTDLETWATQVLNRTLRFEAAGSSAPWEHELKTADIRLADRSIGRLTVVSAAGKRRIDEHLTAWSVGLAELRLSEVVDLPREERKLVPVPVYPRIDVDFSLLVPSARRYAELEGVLAGYDHPLLRRLAFVDAFEGGSVPAGQRSLTFRATIADPARTLTENDVQEFRSSFIAFASANGMTLRS
jgi:phenylalanyl-tRNA synthetase beta chain